MNSSKEQEMNRYYNEASENYKQAAAAAKAGYIRMEESYVEKGAEAQMKAEKIANDSKKEIESKYMNEARTCYDKSAEAQAKGNDKLASEYQKQGDAKMEEMEKKTKEITEKQQEKEREIRQNKEGLEHRKY